MSVLVIDCYWCGFGGIRFPHVMGFDYLALKLITKNNCREIGSGPRGFMLISVL